MLYLIVVISHGNVRKLLRKKTNYFIENDTKNSGLKKNTKSHVVTKDYNYYY